MGAATRVQENSQPQLKKTRHPELNPDGSSKESAQPLKESKVLRRRDLHQPKLQTTARPLTRNNLRGKVQRVDTHHYQPPKSRGGQADGSQTTPHHILSNGSKFAKNQQNKAEKANEKTRVNFRASFRFV